ncbi:MAG: digeranylgeranylglyceryl phosphate synthase, partial [Candidatus Diapherotrites archaeon]|nr:digeranylgeranylglyceryl phosphate synthase [Candidatus Diapherotrites archaeon]
YQAVVFLATAAFLVNWAREIVKDVEDEQTDRGNKVTLPMMVRAHVVDAIVAVLVFAGIVVSFIPVYLELFGNFWYLLLVGIASMLFLKATWELKSFKPAQSQRTFKIAMAIALLGFLAGSFR